MQPRGIPTDDNGTPPRDRELDSDMISSSLPIVAMRYFEHHTAPNQSRLEALKLGSELLDATANSGTGTHLTKHNLNGHLHVSKTEQSPHQNTKALLPSLETGPL
jgi:hypothetical protein